MDRHTCAIILTLFTIPCVCVCVSLSSLSLGGGQISIGL